MTPEQRRFLVTLDDALTNHRAVPIDDPDEFGRLVAELARCDYTFTVNAPDCRWFTANLTPNEGTEGAHHP